MKVLIKYLTTFVQAHYKKEAAMDIDYSKLDPDVIPMVQYFNSIGLPTAMSCAGHKGKPYMSMFWISFSSDVEMKHLVNFMRKHSKDNKGAFASCGHFVQRLIFGPGGPQLSWRYEAANLGAASTDLIKWQRDDAENV